MPRKLWIWNRPTKKSFPSVIVLLMSEEWYTKTPWCVGEEDLPYFAKRKREFDGSTVKTIVFGPFAVSIGYMK
tara:strand:+ start:334 stop:552 length:219 start_codon:yes stop_codon:yes gene_type:complete